MAALKEEGLKMFNARPYQTICGLQHARDVIKAAFDIIWPKFHLDFARVWIAYKDEDHVTFSSSLEDTQRKRMLGIKLIDRYGERESYGGDYYVYEGFSYYGSMCHKLPLKMGEGLIGKTLQNCKPQFIKKVSRLRDNEPLMLVRYQDFQGISFECSCFVICLRSTETNDLDYVFEFLWHEVPDHAILLESLLLLLKECLPNFKYAPRGELGDELRIIDVENSIDNEIKSFTIFRGNKSSLTLEALEKSSVVKDCITPLEVKCMAYPISLSQGGMIEAAKNPDVSLSTLKRKRKDQSNTNEEDKGAFQDPSANNREMYLDENALTIKAEYADDMIKFTLPISSATFVAIQKEIGNGFELNPANYKIKYLDEDGDWILLKSDKDMKVCIKGRRNLTSIVRLRLVARQPSDPSYTYQAT